MSDAPERIWFDPDKNGIGWTTEQREAMTCDVEYVLASRLTAAVAENDAMRSAIRAKGGTEHAPTEYAYLAACRAIEKHRERADAAEAEIARLRGVLEWYRDMAAGCRKIGGGGDIARHALDNDGGARARAALAETERTKMRSEED